MITVNIDVDVETTQFQLGLHYSYIEHYKNIKKVTLQSVARGNLDDTDRTQLVNKFLRRIHGLVNEQRFQDKKNYLSLSKRYF